MSRSAVQRVRAEDPGAEDMNFLNGLLELVEENKRLKDQNRELYQHNQRLKAHVVNAQAAVKDLHVFAEQAYKKNAESCNSLNQEIATLKGLLREKEEALRLAHDSKGPYR